MVFPFKESQRHLRWMGLSLLVGSLWFSGRLLGGPITVTDAYGRALRFYSQGRLKEAFKIATSTIRHYPAHQPSYLLAGQILYRIGKFDRASRFFRKVSPDMLSGEIAYIYGVTFFSSGNCTQAEEGFSRVQVASPVGKLASFYRGICSARGRSWTTAEKQLLAATPIPPHLETVRRRALEQVRTALNAERTAPPLTNVQYIYVQAPPTYITPQSYAQPSLDGTPPSTIYQPKKRIPPTPSLPSGFTGAVTPNGEIKQTQFTRDFTGFKRENGTEQSLSGKLALLGRYNAEGNAGGGQPYASIAAEGGLTSVDTKGKASSLVAYDNAPDAAAVQETTIPTGKKDTLRIAVNPEASYPILGLIDTTLGGKWINTSVTGNVTEKFTRHEGYASIGYGVNTQIKATGTLVQKLDQDGVNVENATLFGGQLTHIVGPATITFGGQYAIRALTKKPDAGIVLFRDEGPSQFDGTIISGDGSARKNWDTFSLTFAGSGKYFTPSSPLYKKSLENLSAKFEVSGVKTWPFGLSLTITGSYTQLQEYKIEVEKPKEEAQPGTPLQDSETPPPEKVIAVANGEQIQGLAALKYSPIPLISIGATYDVIKGDFTPTEKTLDKAVKGALPSLNTKITFLAGFQSNF
jgi:hypothetical protein